MRYPALIPLIGLGTALAACAPAADDSADAEFAALQERGAAVMGVDQYVSTHIFEDLPDGGRIILDRDDPADTAAIRVIRAHMEEVATEFRSGDFSMPMEVHTGEVPGANVLAEKKGVITYEVLQRPRGGEVRIKTTDSVAVKAVHAFLEFQRMDHRVGGTEHHMGGGAEHKSGGG